MILLDTDHLVALKYSQGDEHARLVARMLSSSDQNFVTTSISVEEQLRGWLALINRSPDVHRQVSAYQRLNALIDFFAGWARLDFDSKAADQFTVLRSQKIRIGSMDLKIASIALVHNLAVLTANLRDFQHVPNLRCEDWLH